MGQNTRHDSEFQRKEAEQELKALADAVLREELRSILLTALGRGSDALHGVQRLIGHDLVRLKLLHPDIRFLDTQGEVADRIVEVPLEVPSTEPFDPHELSSVQLLQLVRQRLWEDTRIQQKEREELLALTTEITRRLGSMRS
jgi:hypothetical protein